MISYGNPVCAITQNRATLFCYEANCTHSAFACAPDCLTEEGHTNHRTTLWSQIEGSVRQVMELELSKGELQQLQKQEKQMKIIKEEIRMIMDTHQKTIIRFKKNLQLKDDVLKIVSALRHKETSKVTGNDMANLIRSLYTNDIFRNKIEVEKSISQQNQRITKLLSALNTQIDEYKQPKQPPKKQEPKQPEQVTSTTILTKYSRSDELNLFLGVIGFNVKPGLGRYCPVFGNECIEVNQSFEVEVYDAAQREFLIGVVPWGFPDWGNQSYLSDKSVCVSGRDGTIYFNKQSFRKHFVLNTGDKVKTVRTEQNMIKWFRNGEELCYAFLPKHVAKRQIFPVIWIYSFPNPEHISIFRFL